MVKGKDNSLLVEFEFVVDLDLAMFKFIRDNYFSSDMVNHDFLSVKDEREVIYNMLNRSHINPLEYIIPGQDTTELYWDLLNNEGNFVNLLKYATAYDTFALMITYLREASSVSIDILCKNKLEEEFIHKLNPIIQTIVVPNRKDVNLNNYSALYVKYYPYLSNYSPIEGKHIFVPAARFNMEPGKDMVSSMFVKLYGQSNELHIIDLYRNVKFRFTDLEEESEDEN